MIVGWSLPASNYAPTNTAPAGYHFIESKMHGKVLTAMGINSCSPVMLFDKDHGHPTDQASQLWRVENYRDGLFWLTPSSAPNMVLDVAEGKSIPGTRLILYPRQYPPARNQLFGWSMDRLFSSFNHNLVLDVEGENRANGAPVIIWETNQSGGAENQRWQLS